MSLNRELSALGLSPKEATVYVALLELGTASVQAIARRADLVRPTTYVILEALAKKGLVSKATGPDAKKMLFQAEPPERLARFLDQQREEIEHRRKELDQLLPDLLSSYARGEDRPRVRLFEGKEGLRLLQEEFVRGGKGPVVGVAPDDELRALFPPDEYNRDIRSVRVREGIRSRHISVSAAASDHSPEEDAALLRESRRLSPKQLPIKASFAVNGAMLSLVSFRNKIIGVLIEHEDIANSFRAMFEVLWKIGEPSASAPTRAAAPVPLTASRAAP